MSSTTVSRPSHSLFAPIGWVGRTALAVLAYAGGLTLLTLGAAVSPLNPFRRSRDGEPGFVRTMIHEAFWMLAMGLPLVGMVHIAVGSFLSLQAYYGSTFVDGTGAVVGVGLLRNLGGLMTGLTLAGILAARMVPELRALVRPAVIRSTVADATQALPPVRDANRRGAPNTDDSIRPGRLAGPRIAAAAVACTLLSQWGVAVGTLVGWQASQSMMGLSSDVFFLMMGKMMWLRDVVSLLIKGLLYGGLPGAICCYEGMRPEEPPAGSWLTAQLHPSFGMAPSLTVAVFRAAFLSFVAILIVNASWFILVYHAVPFYGPTLLPPARP
jgi:phospholipid/cholesterol/gamma-HCH transport system permease protein